MADYRGNVVSTILSSELLSNVQALGVVLPSLLEHEALSLKAPDALHTLLAEINSCLNSSVERQRGLVLLKSLLHQCSAEVFSNSFQTWFQLLVQILQSYGSPAQYQHALKILSLLIERVPAFPELARDVGTTKIKTLISALLALPSQIVQAAKEAIASCFIACILHFPGPTSPFKTNIEAFLIEELDRPFPSQVHVRCYALLAQCTTGGYRGSKQQEGWSSQFEKVMSTLNYLLSQLYLGLESGEEAGEDCMFTCSAPDTHPEQTICLVRRFFTVTACLAALLREPFPTWVPISVDEILRFICRTLAVQVDMLVSKLSTGHLHLLTFLPSLQTSAFNVLKHLIICAKRTLIHDGELILKLCGQCLTSTHIKHIAAGSQKPFRKLRETVYQILEAWLQVSGPASGCSDNAAVSLLKDLLMEIYFDISPQQPEALQLESKKENSNLLPAKKKKKKNKHNNYQELSAGTHFWHTQDNEKMALAALKVLELLIINTGATISEELFNEVQHKVRQMVTEVQRSRLPPYSSSLQCRQQLYQVLLAAVCVPRPHPTLLQQAIHLFQRGSGDSHLQVITTCREALTRCGCLIHPMVPCLLAPVVKPALPAEIHPPASPSDTAAIPSTSISDNTISTTIINNSIITHASSAKNVQSAQSSRLPKSKANSAISSSHAADNQRRSAAASALDHSGEAEPDSASVSMVHPIDVSMEPTPSTSSSIDLAGDRASVKRKRESLAGDDSDDDGVDNDADSDEEGGESERPSQSKAETVESSGGQEKMAESREAESITSDREDEVNSGGEEQSADVSAMLMSFDPCEADSNESDVSD